VQKNEKARAWIMQPQLIHHLREIFGEEVKDMQAYSTPGTPRLKIVRPTNGIEGINETMQSRYRSGVGMLLYLIKHSCPDIANIVRELSKGMDSATIASNTLSTSVWKRYDSQHCVQRKLEPNPEEETRHN